jgi:hypothetical protein
MKLNIEAKLKKGYDKLVSFKTKEKGYEWFELQIKIINTGRLVGRCA